MDQLELFLMFKAEMHFESSYTMIYTATNLDQGILLSIALNLLL